MNTSRQSLFNRRLAILLAGMLLIAGATLALLPGTGHAQSACALPARLQVGDAVEVVDGTANNLRQWAGLSAPLLSLKMPPGAVWYVQEGPVCVDGINWYQVAAYDADGWTAEGEPGAGYYLMRTDLQPSEGCYSDRLAVGMRVQVGDTQRQHVRARPSVNAPRSAWLYPGVPVTIMDGPRCANGWVWWNVRDDSGRIQGWASEGNGPAVPWLVPAWGSASGGSSGDAAPTPCWAWWTAATAAGPP